MNYNEIVAYLEANFGTGTKPGTERVTVLLNELGNPQDKLKVIHVAGTNGKGSTIAVIANILTQAGYKTGMYISPHLFTMRERMVIDGIMISEEDMVKVSTHVINKAELMKTKGLEAPTHFELITAIAMFYFAAKGIDLLVLEVGMGGRYDATNVVEPIMAVIAAISMDHMNFLGNTIKEIAHEKAGIIKVGIPTIAYPQRYGDATNEIKKECEEKHSELIQVEKDFINLIEYEENYPVIDYKSYLGEISGARLGLIGDHQLLNAAVAITAILKLKKMGYNIENENIIEGLKNVIWPCRFTILSREPLIIIDGAHNNDGIDALYETIKSQWADYEVIGITGMLKDKSYNYAATKMGSLMKKCITLTPDSTRALDKEELAQAYEDAGVEAHYAKDIEEALNISLENINKKTLICIFGSLYLTGEIYKKMTGQ